MENSSNHSTKPCYDYL